VISIRRILRGAAAGLGALLAMAAAGEAQETTRLLVVDGTRVQVGRTAYGTESEAVRRQVLRNPAALAAAAPACPRDTGNNGFRADDMIGGSFTAPGAAETAYLYTLCDSGAGHRQGILILRRVTSRATGRDPFVAHLAYAFARDVKLVVLPDIDGNGRNEIAIVSDHGRQGKSVRIVEIGRGGVTRFGRWEIETLGPFRQMRLYAEKRVGAPPAFFADFREMTASGWRAPQPAEPVTLAPDATAYARGASGPGLRLSDAALLTAIFQAAAFVALILATLAFIVRLFFSRGPRAARRRAAAGPAPPAPALPALQPLNCPACGAGVPLRGDVMVCPSCSHRFAAPRAYDAIRLLRDEAARRLRRATRYWRITNVLTSRWMGRALVALSLWLVASIPLLYIGWDDLAYAERLLQPSVPHVILAGLAYAFWIPTLWATAGMLSPKAREAMPTLEAADAPASAEAANCSQCGGAIRFEKNDLAALCGYCGVETYRARLAWNLHHLANDARKRATFSMIDAMKAVRAAVEDIAATPMIFAFIFIIAPAFLMGLYALAEWLGLVWLLEFFGLA